jgi:hypothetical protein
MLVCRDWADAAGAVLWRRKPTCMLLDVDAARRQVYANWIQELEETPRLRDDEFVALGALAYPRLRVAKLFDPCHGSIRSISNGGINGTTPEEELPGLAATVISQPRLALLECSIHDLLSAPVRARLKRARPHRLRQVRLHCGYSSDETKPIPLLLSALHSLGQDTLDELEINGRLIVSADLFAHFADRRGLKRLQLNILVPGPVIEQALGQPRSAAEAFGKLEMLGLDTNAAGFRLLAATGLPSLLELSLSVDCANDHATTFAALSKLVSLQVLRVSIRPYRQTLAGAVVLALRSLTQLRVLSLSDDAGRLRIAPFSDADFAKLVAALPLLESLWLAAECGFSPAAIRIAGECCRRLRELVLRQRLDMSLLPPAATAAEAAAAAAAAAEAAGGAVGESPGAAQGIPPLFPALRRLQLTSPRSSEPYWLHSPWPPYE